MGGKGRANRQKAGGARVAYCVTLVCGFLLVFFFGGVVPYTLFYLLLLLPIGGFLQLFLAARAIKSSVTFAPERIVRGADAEMQVTLHNSSRFLPVALVEITLPDSSGLSPELERVYICALLPGQSKQITLPLKFQYRGVYDLTPARIALGDFLRLFRLPVRRIEPQIVVSHPELITLSRLGVMEKLKVPAGRQQLRGLEEISVVSDTRRYAYGDPLSRVHWNLTAKQSDLVTKLYDHEQDEQILVLLDLGQVSPDREAALPLEDCLIHACLAAVQALLAERKPIALRYYGGEILREVRERADGRLDSLYAALSMAEFADVPPVSQLLGNTQARCILIFSTRLKPEEVGTLVKAAPRDSLMRVFVVKDDGYPFHFEADDTLQILRPGDNLKARLEL